MIELNKIYNEDCLEGSEQIAPGSVDLILTDLPYGTMQGIADGDTSWSRTNTEWDFAIPPSDIYAVANRVLRKNGKMVLFSQEPYTSQLINDAIPNIPFSYRMIWEKNIYGNALFAKKAPLIFFEDILVFSKPSPKLDYSRTNPLREVLSKYVVKHGKEFFVELFKKEGRYTSEESAKVHASYKMGYSGGARMDLLDEKMYNFLSRYTEFEESYEDIKRIYTQHHEENSRILTEKYPSVFNLWEGGKYKSNILRYKKDYDGYHPTQKPVALLEDLIKTFSNEGDTVVDLTIGSGSTAIAAMNTKRNFIGFELDKDYFNLANERIETHVKEE